MRPADCSAAVPGARELPKLSVDDGGPAFPHAEHNHDGTHWIDHNGMTLRDYFAAKAMAAMIGTSAAPALFGLAGAEGRCARAAYAMADAMLKAREQAP